MPAEPRASLFLLLSEYTAPPPEVEQHLAAHRDHLAKGYDMGLLLASGRQQDALGGALVAVGSRADVDALVRDDPFTLHGVARCAVVEVQPTRLADELVPILAARGLTL